MDEKDKIEIIMQELNLNSAQFAMEIGIQGSTLSHILNGRNKPSLDVLKKILNRFSKINPEWLILDSGDMFRQEKNSQAPTLFDSLDETISKSTPKTLNSIVKNNTIVESNQQQNVNYSENYTSEPNLNLPNNNPVAHVVEKTVKKVIVYYNDNTFQEFESK